MSRLTKLCLVLALCAAPLAAVPVQAQNNDAQKVARLAIDVQRLEDLRAVKRLQMSYSQYSQGGLWSQMAGLFTDNAVAIYGNDNASGKAAIGQYFLKNWGGGREGLAPGGVSARISETPVVNLSDDGKSARGRFWELAMTGQMGGPETARGWEIGIMENVYQKQNGVWKISFVHYYPYVAGSYKDGWKNVGPELPVVTYHYTPQSAPIAVPEYPADMAVPAISGPPAEALAGLTRRITALNDEDAVRNLQNMYGYYIDRKMWDDAGDLFTADAVLEDAGVGIWSGKAIRAGFERMGPPGLKRGQLNEHLQLAETVSVDGNEAQIRGIEFRELGEVDSGQAQLGLGSFVNRFVKGADGKWRIREMRVFPLALTDYYQGWQKSRLTSPAATGKAKPSKPVPDGDKIADGIVPAFFQNHPVSGQPVALPAGMKMVATDRLLPAYAGGPAAMAPASLDAGLVEARRLLARSLAYDSIDNVTHAFGQYINDNDFDEQGMLYAADGWRGKQAVGFCVGPRQVALCEATWGASREVHFDLSFPHTSLSARWMMQPVIVLGTDGIHAAERTRLHSFGMSNVRAGVLSGAMYNNQFKLVDGVWKADVVSIEEPYWSSSSYEDGWARYKPGQGGGGGQARAADAPTPTPPDVDRTKYLKIRFWGINNHPDPKDVVLWPDIKPMWFNVVNPVSGRLPPNYCPDMKTCERDLEAQGHVPVR